MAGGPTFLLRVHVDFSRAPLSVKEEFGMDTSSRLCPYRASEGGPMLTKSPYIAFTIAAVWLYAGCSGNSIRPSQVPAQENAAAQPDAAIHTGHLSPSANEDKGYIKGWFDGEEVQLYYTKSYFCDALSAGATPCEVGAPPADAPRPCPVPTIYAIVATPRVLNDVNFNPATLACLPGTPCLNHPLMIDLSRIGAIPPIAGPAAHSHILSARGGGWFHTVNIRVFA